MPAASSAATGDGMSTSTRNEDGRSGQGAPAAPATATPATAAAVASRMRSLATDGASESTAENPREVLTVTTRASGNAFAAISPITSSPVTRPTGTPSELAYSALTSASDTLTPLIRTSPKYAEKVCASTPGAPAGAW